MPEMQAYETNRGLTIIRTRKPSLELAQLAQPIGYAAWKERMPQRPDSQVRNVFNPDNPQNAEKLLARMKSKVGKFVGVVAVKNEQQIGYAWATDDVGNMNHLMQYAKVLGGKWKGEKPFVWNAHINVLPEWQGKGVGSVLLREVLAPFDSDQRVSAYVFDENVAALGWFMSRGFKPRPKKPVDPNEKPSGPDMYFGEGAEHVSQWRFEAPSVDVVLSTEAEGVDRSRYEVVEGT